MKYGFGQFCPVAVACEVFAARWTPIILRELLSHFAGAPRPAAHASVAANQREARP